MSFKLCSIVNIGQYKVEGGVYQVNVKRSVKNMIDTALIEMPAIGRVNDDGNLPDTSVATSKLFNPGDPVTIQLGYNNTYNTEFRGFVNRVTPTVPVQIECEGYSWQLKQQPWVKSWKSISLKDFLTELVQGTDIALNPQIPDYTLTNLQVKHANKLKALDYVLGKIHLAVFFQFNSLYVGLEEGLKGNTVPLRLGWNTIRDNNLKWRLASDTQVLVRLVTGKGKRQKRSLIEVGDKGGGLVERTVNNVQDEAALKAIANDLLLQSKYTGFEGYITCFLQPFIQPTDTAAIIDKLYDVRTGHYFVNGYDLDFGVKTRGAIRKVHIGRSLTGAANG